MSAEPAFPPETPDLREELSRKDAEIEELRQRLDLVTRRMEEDLRVAARVQRALLPHPRALSGLDVAREFMPFREVGGDYYDIVDLGAGKVAVAIGDVMGKGVPAALLAANLKASLRAHLQTGEGSVAEVVSRVNRLFYEVTPRGRFATFFLARFDLTEGRLEYVNAGHDYPFLVRASGGALDLVRGGTVLGLLDEVCYESGAVDFAPGDMVVFFTDGVTDRANACGEHYGVERLKDAAERSRSHSPRIALYSLLGELQDWSAGNPPEDDMTLLVAKRA